MYVFATAASTVAAAFAAFGLEASFFSFFSSATSAASDPSPSPDEMSTEIKTGSVFSFTDAAEYVHRVLGGVRWWLVVVGGVRWW